LEVAVPRWSSRSFLVYAGGFTVLGSALGWLTWLSAGYGDAAFTAWALLVTGLLYGAAFALLRSGHRIAAGVFAFAGVIAFASFVAALFTWFGWLGQEGSASTFRGFDTGRLLVELLALGAAAVSLRAFRHPLLVLPVAFISWLFITDLVSNGGDWSAIVSLLVGIAFLACGLSADAGPRRPYGFWLHVAAGLAIGGSILQLSHSGNVEWIIVCLGSLVYVRFADVLGRSSWAVLGAVGLLVASSHFALEWASVSIPFFGPAGHASRGWVPPLVSTVTGVLLVVLGLWIGRRDQIAARQA
jgi:hypothetical protein